MGSIIRTDKDKEEHNARMKKSVIGDDLAAARRKGQTYNEMFAQAREEGRKKGILSEEAYKAGRAYELYTPKEVREAYEADPQYFEGRAKEGAPKKMSKGGKVSASSRADGCVQRGKTRGKMV